MRPEALAAAGLFVYAHVDDTATEPYRRIAGPTVAADLVDLEPVVQLVASLVKLPVRFEEVELAQARLAFVPALRRLTSATQRSPRAISAKPAPRFDGAIQRGGTLSTRA